MIHEDLSEPDRYDTADDWQPKPSPAKYKKLLADYKRAHPEDFCLDSIFETRTANDCTRTPAAKKQQYDLFGPLWRTGEVAVLVGESGVGKSLLAVQIAESIARGRPVRTGNGSDRIPASGNYQFSTLNSQLKAPAQPVLYLDLQHSDAQFAERYRCSSPVPGKLPVRYRFSSKLSRTSYGDLRIPEAFRGDVARYYRHSLNRMLTSSEAKVLIVDNLSLLDPRSSGAAAAIRTMQMLKRIARVHGFSILVLAQSKQKVRIQKSAAGNSYSLFFTIHSSLSESADSVFALGRTSFDESMRYIKPLKANYVPMDNGKLKMENSSDQSLFTINCSLSTEVSVYQLGRSEGPARVSSPHVSKGHAMIPHAASSGVATNASNSQLSTLNSQLPPKPFLGFTHLGVSAEQDLIRDYEREYREAEARERSRLKKLQRSSREILVDGVLDGSYGRYLKGE